MYVDTNYPILGAAAAATSNSALIWILVISFIIAFFLAFGVGANDVANSFGTSVGSKVLTLRQACILATIFEIAGAVSMGYNVSSTIRNGMINLGAYENEVKLLMLGFLAALIGSTIWNLIATLAGMPISGTHSIVGAIIGFSVVAKGWGSVKWMGLIKIVASWFVSPLLSGIVSLAIYLFIRHYIINSEQALAHGLLALPFFYSVTVFVNVFSIVHAGPGFLASVTWWMALLVAGAVAVVVALGVWFIVVPRLKAKILTLLDVLGGGGEKKDGVPVGATAIEMTNTTTTTTTTSAATNEAVDAETAAAAAALDAEQVVKRRRAEGDRGDDQNGEVNGNLPSMTDLNSTTTTTTPPISNGHINPAFDSPPTMVNGNGKGGHYPEVKPVVRRSERARSFDDGTTENRTVEEKAAVAAKEKELEGGDEDDDKPEVAQLFTFLQILTACFGSFAHGGNDVSNAIGPLVAVLLLYKDGSAAGSTPAYILLYGGLGISIGLWAWGRRVIRTMGNDLTKITPSTGFTIEIGAAITVLVASKVGLPISTTHCKVGSVVLVGRAQKSQQGVNWRLFANIAATWILTVPLTALMSAFSMWLLMYAL